MDAVAAEVVRDRGQGSRPCMEVRGVEVRVGENTLVQNLTFSLSAPDFLAVMGPSGAGKTSMLRTLAGMNPMRTGSVNFRNKNGRGIQQWEFRKELGLVFQHLRLAPNLSVLTSVLCGRLGREPWWKTLFGFAAAERERALQLLDEFGLGGFEHAPVGKLSGGEKQRVAIVRALVQRPCILLADEPISHLDRELSRNVLTRLKQLAREESFFLCCVLHDEALAGELADACLTISRELPGGWSLQNFNPRGTPV